MDIDAASVLYIAGLAVGLWALAVAAIAAFVSWQLSKPAPKGGSDYKLPNGMVIKQWQELETKFLFQEIFGSDSAYYREGLQFAPGQTIVDAGANIGMFTLFAAKATNGDARIVSFEPIPSTYGVLAANCVSAAGGRYSDVFKPSPGAQPRITPLQLGLSDVAADVVFEHSPHLSIWSARDPSFVEERKRRFSADVKRSMAQAGFLVQLLMPMWLVDWLVALFIRNMAATVPVPAKLVTLSSVIDEQHLGVIDVLKVDVEGSEEAVLRGIRAEHWPRIQQVVLEVENFAAVASIKKTLESRGFRVTHFASEREKNPASLSEVSMMYAVRPGYRPGQQVPAAVAASSAAVGRTVSSKKEAAAPSLADDVLEYKSSRGAGGSATKAGRGRSASRSSSSRTASSVGAGGKSPSRAKSNGTTGASPSPASARRRR